MFCEKLTIAHLIAGLFGLAVVHIVTKYAVGLIALKALLKQGKRNE
jgi:hypothetical protein